MPGSAQALRFLQSSHRQCRARRRLWRAECADNFSVAVVVAGVAEDQRARRPVWCLLPTSRKVAVVSSSSLVTVKAAVCINGKKCHAQRAQKFCARVRKRSSRSRQLVVGIIIYNARVDRRYPAPAEVSASTITLSKSVLIAVLRINQRPIQSVRRFGRDKGGR